MSGVTCGPALKTRTVVCTRKGDLQTVSDDLCDAGSKPPTSQTDDIGTATCGW